MFRIVVRAKEIRAAIILGDWKQIAEKSWRRGNQLPVLQRQEPKRRSAARRINRDYRPSRTGWKR